MLTAPSAAEPRYALGPALEFLVDLSMLNHAIEIASSRMEQTLGVSSQQRLLLRFIGKFSGITAGDLARLLHLDPGTISAGLRRLAERGLVRRRVDPHDRRRAPLALTAAGRSLERPTALTVERAVERLLEGAPLAESRTARKVFRTLAALLVDATATAVLRPSKSSRVTRGVRSRIAFRPAANPSTSRRRRKSPFAQSSGRLRVKQSVKARR